MTIKICLVMIPLVLFAMTAYMIYNPPKPEIPVFDVKGMVDAQVLMNENKSLRDENYILRQTYNSYKNEHDSLVSHIVSLESELEETKCKLKEYEEALEYSVMIMENIMETLDGKR